MKGLMKLSDYPDVPDEAEHRGSCFVDYAGEPSPAIMERAASKERPLGTLLWRGRQWAVTEDGLERLDGGYFIDKTRLTENLGTPEYFGWPTHIGLKPQTDVNDFITAWLVGLTLHGFAEDPEQLRRAIAHAPPHRGTRPIPVGVMDREPAPAPPRPFRNEQGDC